MESTARFQKPLELPEPLCPPPLRLLASPTFTAPAPLKSKQGCPATMTACASRYTSVSWIQRQCLSVTCPAHPFKEKQPLALPSTPGSSSSKDRTGIQTVLEHTVKESTVGRPSRSRRTWRACGWDKVDVFSRSNEVRSRKMPACIWGCSQRDRTRFLGDERFSLRLRPLSGSVRSRHWFMKPNSFNLGKCSRVATTPVSGLRKSCGVAPSVIGRSKAVSKKKTYAGSSGPGLGKVSQDNYNGIHHVGVLCQDLSASLNFYCNILGMEVNPDRPDGKLPYKGAWLWVGGEMIHLMELPNPDPEEGRPEHGGRDRHVCLSVNSIEPLEEALKDNNISYTKSKSGRAALFFRDPDWNVLEMAEQ